MYSLENAAFSSIFVHKAFLQVLKLVDILSSGMETPWLVQRFQPTIESSTLRRLTGRLDPSHGSHRHSVDSGCGRHGHSHGAPPAGQPHDVSIPELKMSTISL